MSDNPDQLTFGIETDQEGFNTLQTNILRIGEVSDATGLRVLKLGESSENATGGILRLSTQVLRAGEDLQVLQLKVLTLHDTVQRVPASIDELANALRKVQPVQEEWTLSIDDTIKRLKDIDLQKQIDDEIKLAKATQDEADAEQARADALDRAYEIERRGGIVQLEDLRNAQAQQASQNAGGDGGGEGDISGGGGGSLYGVGRAFSAGGALGRRLGSPELGSALTETGELLRFGQGVQRLTQYFTELGIPMAALEASVLPLALGIGAFLAVLRQFQEDMKASEISVSNAISTLKTFYTAIEDGTAQTIRAAIAAEQIKKDIADREVDRLQKAKDSAIQQTGVKPDDYTPKSPDEIINSLLPQAANLVPNITVTALTASEPFKKISSELETAQKAAQDAQNAIDGYNRALQDQQVAVNTAIEATRAAVDERIKREHDLISIQQLSSKAAEDKISILEKDRQQQLQAIQDLQDADTKYNTTNSEHGRGYISDAEHQKNLQAIEAHRKALGDDTNTINDTTTALETLIIPREKEAELIKLQNDAIQRHIGYLQTENDLIESGTPDQAKSKERSLRGDLAGAQYELEQIQDRSHAPFAVNPADQQRMEELKAKIKDINDELYRLGTVIEPIVLTNKALKDMADAADKFNKEAGTVTNNLAIQTNTAKEREANAEKQYTQGSLQDTEARYQIALKESRAETDLQQKTADAIADIQTKLHDKLVKINVDYWRQQEDDQLKARTDQDKIQTEADRQQQSDLTDHLNKIAEINRNAFASEKQDLYDRNFLAYAKDETKRQTDLAAEDSSAQQKTAKLETHLRQQEQDLGKSLANQEAQQKKDWERKLEDAQTAGTNEQMQQVTNETRKLQALKQSEDQQIADLNHTETYKIRLLQQGLQEELALYSQQAQARIRIAAQERDAVTSQAQVALNQIQTYQQQQHITNTTQAIYPWQAAPISVNNTQQFNTSVTANQAVSQLFSAGSNIVQGIESLLGGVLR